MPDTVRSLERDVPFSVNGDVQPGGISAMVLNWIGNVGHLAPPYWSRARDAWLDNFWRSNDYLGIAVYTFVSKTITIPMRVEARDHSIRAHLDLAQRAEHNLLINSGLLKGFTGELAKFIIDYLSQDNGAFFLIMGRGRADGPIVGLPSGLLHLDSYQCTRTGDPEYPVLYSHIDGKTYKLHYTRVIEMASLPSPRSELCGVGYCSLSRVINASQETLDMVRHSQEKFGSRPARQVLYVKRGATLTQLQTAIRMMDSSLDNQQLQLFSKTMLMAPDQGRGELELDKVDLSTAPDGFNRRDVTMLDAAVIAAGFGLDMRDLAHAFGIAGQTRADAEVQDRKGRGKGVGEFVETLVKQLDQKFLPSTVRAVSDYVDDEQDEQQAEIRNTRTQARERDLRSGAADERLVHEQMLEMGELNDEQFADLELRSGRLEDGSPVLSLLHSPDPQLRALLGELPPVDPLLWPGDPDDALRTALERYWALSSALFTARNSRQRHQIHQAMAAVDALIQLYRGASAPITPEEKGVPDEEEIEEEVEDDAEDNREADTAEEAGREQGESGGGESGEGGS